MADHRGCDGLEEGEEGAQGAAEEDDVVFRIDRNRERLLICVEVVEYAIEGGGWV